jgi:hypothetical protein
MGWFERAWKGAKQASAGQRVTRSDKQQAMDTWAELNALSADRERLMREGLAGVATIVGIPENVATGLSKTLGSWHELELDVRLPDQDPFRATRALRSNFRRPHISGSAPRCRCG